MATLRKKYAKENYKVHILSRDRDMFQVISENINVIEHLDE
jgi:5'-3' exonuclease